MPSTAFSQLTRNIFVHTFHVATCSYYANREETLRNVIAFFWRDHDFTVNGAAIVSISICLPLLIAAAHM